MRVPYTARPFSFQRRMPAHPGLRAARFKRMNFRFVCRRQVLKTGALMLCAAALTRGPAVHAQAVAPIRLALIESMSGPFANTGEAVVRNLLWAVERVNARGGVRLAGGARMLQLDRYDSKGQNEEALSALRSALDDGARIVLQGNSSVTAAALLDAIDKHNERDPARRAIFLNYSAVDPALTNERCSFWHFRFD
ncbi:MAG: branched-chain amino acid transporter substrate-binding protein, partial [Variovorax sp.]|nr:branched-chain amino acid transporter substrate-binding protein [Variovorax sp.]